MLMFVIDQLDTVPCARLTIKNSWYIYAAKVGIMKDFKMLLLLFLLHCYASQEVSAGPSTTFSKQAQVAPTYIVDLDLPPVER